MCVDEEGDALSVLAQPVVAPPLEDSKVDLYVNDLAPRTSPSQPSLPTTSPPTTDNSKIDEDDQEDALSMLQPPPLPALPPATAPVPTPPPTQHHEEYEGALTDDEDEDEEEDALAVLMGGEPKVPVGEAGPGGQTSVPLEEKKEEEEEEDALAVLLQSQGPDNNKKFKPQAPGYSDFGFIPEEEDKSSMELIAMLAREEELRLKRMQSDERRTQALIAELERQEAMQRQQFQQTTQRDEQLAAEMARKLKEEEEKQLAQALRDEEEAKRLGAAFGVAADDFECPICMDDKKAGEGLCLSCNHVLCVDCFSEGIKICLREKRLFKCPNAQCKQMATSRSVTAALGRDIGFQYAGVEQKQMVMELEGLWHCLTPDCPNSILIAKDELRTGRYKCAACNKVYCVRCNVEWHDGSSCEQYQKWKKENDQGDKLFDQMVRNGDVRSCECGAKFVKEDGCECVTCRCGRKMCWICGKFLRKEGDRCAHAWYH
eukprot:TRINITY_DN11476_c0_g1_i5.p1 TRINITY_DN11476_c0_g1~~TRINITY_DN11476_c0_g1_i5.p1  ORF type:complete len:506 (+),score=147.27 TRINITY_DN11476_c0_g1_i5:59-1519(+)